MRNAVINQLSVLIKNQCWWSLWQCSYQWRKGLGLLGLQCVIEVKSAIMNGIECTLYTLIDIISNFDCSDLVPDLII